MLVAHGDQGGGYLIYVEDGRLHFAHNHRGKLRVVSTDAVLPESSLKVEVDVAAPGSWLWDVRLLVDGDAAAPTMEVPMLWGQVPFQGIDIGADRASPVSWPLREAHGAFGYRGRIRSVTYQPGEFAPDSPYRAGPDEVRAMARAIFDAIQ